MKRKTLDAEKRNGSELTHLSDREFSRTVSEKVGTDGVIETHVNFEPTKKSGFRKTYKERGNYTTGGACFKSKCLNRIGKDAICRRDCHRFNKYREQ